MKYEVAQINAKIGNDGPIFSFKILKILKTLFEAGVSILKKNSFWKLFRITRRKLKYTGHFRQSRECMCFSKF